MNLKPNQTFLTTKYKQQAKYFEEIELNKILKRIIKFRFKLQEWINRFANRTRKHIV